MSCCCQLSCNCPCRQSNSEPSCTHYGNRCRIPLAFGPGCCDQSYITKKDHMYFNTRRCQCSWSPRFDDKHGWNSKDAPVYCTRFDAPSPVKPPWCPPGCKTRSYLYPRYYKRNCDGWYPDECKCRPKCRVRNPCGTANDENTCGIRKWSVPLCPCPLCGRSRNFPSPCCCGCAPSPSAAPLRLRCCNCRDGCNKSPCCCCHHPCSYMPSGGCGCGCGCSCSGCCIPPRGCCSCSGSGGCGRGNGCGNCCNNNCCGPPRACQSNTFDQRKSCMSSSNNLKGGCNNSNENDYNDGVTRGNDAGSFGCSSPQYGGDSNQKNNNFIF